MSKQLSLSRYDKYECPPVWKILSRLSATLLGSPASMRVWKFSVCVVETSIGSSSSLTGGAELPFTSAAAILLVGKRERNHKNNCEKFRCMLTQFPQLNTNWFCLLFKTHVNFIHRTKTTLFLEAVCSLSQNFSSFET